MRLIKGAEPVGESDWLRFITQHDIRSSIVMSHIRKATMGERVYRNAQPFARELAGRMRTFAHTGWLPEIRERLPLRPDGFTPIGETDSEHAFCELLQRLRDVWRQPGVVPPLALRLPAISAFAAELRRLGPANFLYSDSDILFAHGDRRKHLQPGKVEPPGLVFLQRRCRGGEADFQTAGVSIKAAAQDIILVASVPLTPEAWTDIGQGEIIAICNGGIISTSI